MQQGDASGRAGNVARVVEVRCERQQQALSGVVEVAAARVVAAVDVALALALAVAVRRLSLLRR